MVLCRTNCCVVTPLYAWWRHKHSDASTAGWLCKRRRFDEPLILVILEGYFVLVRHWSVTICYLHSFVQFVSIVIGCITRGCLLLLALSLSVMVGPISLYSRVTVKNQCGICKPQRKCLDFSASVCSLRCVPLPTTNVAACVSWAPCCEDVEKQTNQKKQ